mmetsp:Transcript_33580/g.92001  ORF Transcript_33580/g.92001 Transcript_33580/m.92001 type:complete len:208 (+) Transcript_33580:952-1575(+)
MLTPSVPCCSRAAMALVVRSALRRKSLRRARTASWLASIASCSREAISLCGVPFESARSTPGSVRTCASAAGFRDVTIQTTPRNACTLSSSARSLPRSPRSQTPCWDPAKRMCWLSSTASTWRCSSAGTGRRSTSRRPSATSTNASSSCASCPIERLRLMSAPRHCSKNMVCIARPLQWPSKPTHTRPLCSVTARRAAGTVASGSYS